MGERIAKRDYAAQTTKLSTREQETLGHLANGRDPEETAQQMGIHKMDFYQYKGRIIDKKRSVEHAVIEAFKADKLQITQRQEGPLPACFNKYERVFLLTLNNGTTADEIIEVDKSYETQRDSIVTKMAANSFPHAVGIALQEGLFPRKKDTSNQ